MFSFIHTYSPDTPFWDGLVKRGFIDDTSGIKLVYCANVSNVDVVMTGGEIRVRGGRLMKTDMSDLRAKLEMQMKPFMESAAEYADII